MFFPDFTVYCLESKEYVGCFKDENSTDRALPGPPFVVLRKMTIDLCADYCFAKGNGFAGLQVRPLYGIMTLFLTTTSYQTNLGIIQ